MSFIDASGDNFGSLTHPSPEQVDCLFQFMTHNPYLLLKGTVRKLSGVITCITFVSLSLSPSHSLSHSLPLSLSLSPTLSHSYSLTFNLFDQLTKLFHPEPRNSLKLLFFKEEEAKSCLLCWKQNSTVFLR